MDSPENQSVDYQRIIERMKDKKEDSDYHR